MPSPDAPALGGDRIEALDVIRGVALCGLVPMNIPDFAFAEDLVFSPGSLAGFDLALWNVLAVLCSGKFMALFSLLFGAGIILSTAKRDAAGEPVTARTMKRLGWLWFFGMLHAYLIWHGDILVAYAVTGFVVFWCRRWNVKTQVICGVLMFSVLPVLAILLGLFLLGLDADALADLNSEMNAVDEDWIEAFRGGWVAQMPVRAMIAFLIQVFGIPLIIFWVAGGLMFFGMALMKTEFLRGDWEASRYRRWAAACVTAGIALCAGGYFLNHVTGWRILYGIFIFPLSYFGTPLLAVGYASLLLFWIKARPRGILQVALGSLGRMAFSNYIGQSVILGVIFYGHGLGLYGHLPYAMVMAIVPAVWVFQAVFSVLWMRRYRFGPLEWAWRCLTYGEKFPLRREA